MKILSGINNPDDLKALSEESLPALCGELREFIINTVSQTGGHLSSNLGVVELTVALHRVYDTSRDRLVFDVGHQSYIHKILTGRRDKMHTLRMLDGIAGFPKPAESIHDAFIAGHASNSVSVALGMARSRTLMQQDYQVAAVIGDGAMTGGLAYEGLEDAGASGEPMVVILNDNGMAISPNVGGLASFLSRRRTSAGYLSFKKAYRQAMDQHKKLYGFVHRMKERIKRLTLPGNMFEDMGFYYLGPVDGGDVLAVEKALRWAKELKIPVLLHVKTKKGMGYALAEDNPEAFHGIGAFNPATGASKKEETSFSKTFGEALCKLAKEEETITAVTAAMPQATGLEAFSKAYPKRFFDVGIAEGHAVSMAAGMAKQGLTPVVAAYSTFLQRGVDMLIHDIGLQKLHVVFGVDRAGLVGRDGETHHGVFDVSYLCATPNMAVFCPSSLAEMKGMLEIAVMRIQGPAAVRYPRGSEGRYKEDTSPYPSVTLLKGEDITLVTYGILINETLKAAVILKERGYAPEIIKLNLINPLDCTRVVSSVEKTGRLLVIEDVCAAGCVGDKLAAAVSKAGSVPEKVKLLNLGVGVVPHGDVDELYYMHGLDAQGIAMCALEFLPERQKDSIAGAETLQEAEDTSAVQTNASEDNTAEKMQEMETTSQDERKEDEAEA